MAKNKQNKQSQENQQPQQQTTSKYDESRVDASIKYLSNQKKILEIEKQLGALDVKNAKTDAERLDILTKRKNLSIQKNKISKENRDLENEIEKSLDNQEKLERGLIDLVSKRRENTRETRDLSNEVAKSIRQQGRETERLSEAGRVVSQNFSATSGFSKVFQGVLEEVNVSLERGVHFSDEFMDVMQENNKIRGEYLDLEKEISKNVEKAAKGEYDAKSMQLDLSDKLNKLRDDENEHEEKVKQFNQDKSKMNQIQISAREKELKLEKEVLTTRDLSIKAMEEQNKVLGETSKQAEKTLGVIEKISSGDFKGALLQSFGLDDINKQLKEKVGGALVNVVNAVKGGDIKGAFSSAGAGLSSLTKLAGAFTMALGIGAIFKLGSFLLDTFMKADQEVADLGKNFGISKNEAKELHHTSVDVAKEMGVVGIHAEQIAKGLENVSQNLGGIDLTGAFSSGNAAVQQMVRDTILLTEKFGLSAEEAGNMSNIAAIAGKSVGEMSMMSSKLGNGIFTAKESMKILAGIPKSIVSSMSKMPEAMIKTAMKAKMLGLDMKQIADIGRKSLDIEQSLEAEMEARVLLGREINLDKMRAAALDGDQETVMNELLKATGSMEDFNKMNVIQKEALAKAAGMEVEQMAEMLGKQEQLNKAGLTQSKVEELQKKGAEELAALAASTNNKDKKAYLEKLAAEKKSESTQADMASLMQRLQELAVKLVTPLMDMVDAFLNGKDGADAMGGIINGIGGFIKTIVPIIKIIASVIGSILGPLGSILGMFGQTEDTAKGVSEGVSKVSEAVKPVEAGFGGILKAVGAIGAFFIGKSLIGKGLDMLKDKAADVGKTIMTKIGGALKDVAGKATGKLGDKLGGLVSKKGGKLFGGGKKEEAGGGGGGDMANVATAEKGKNMVSGVLDKIKSIIDSIKGVVQSAIGFVRDVGKDLLSTLNDLIKGIGDILKTGADIVVNVGTKLADGAMKILNIIMDGLAKAANTLPTIMGALGKAVVAFFQPMRALVDPTVILGIIVFTGAMIGLGYAFKLLGEGIGAAAPGITAFFDGVGGVIEKVGEAIAKVIETITTSIIRLQDIDGKKMILAAYGITAIAGALAAFGGGSAIAGLGSALGKLFDEDPVDKFNRFASINASGLQSVATAINTLGQAIQTFSNISGGLNLDKVGEMISKIEDLKSAQTSAAISDLATTGISAVTSFVGNLFGSSEKQTAQPVAAGAGGGSVAVAAGGAGTNMANVEKKLDTLISVISQAANQPLVIKFGEKTIEEIKSQLNFKKASSGNVDKGYGTTIP